MLGEFYIFSINLTLFAAIFKTLSLLAFSKFFIFVILFLSKISSSKFSGSFGISASLLFETSKIFKACIFSTQFISSILLSFRYNYFVVWYIRSLVPGVSFFISSTRPLLFISIISFACFKFSSIFRIFSFYATFISVWYLVPVIIGK